MRSPRYLFFALLACTLALVPSLCAQTAPAAAPVTITIRMFDARSGQQVVPNNFLIRYDHQDEIHNEHLHIDDEGTAQIIVPAGATFLAVEGTFENSTSLYINCDTGKEKDDRRRHWYPIATILSTGVIAPNECFNGKYEKPRFDPKPGEFDVYVRQHNWRDPDSYE
jgi:hypothetical protein